MKPANDMIFIEGLKLPARIGITAWEQQIQQTLVLDLQIAVDSRQAAKTNDIRHTIDYYEIVKSIQHYTQNRQFQLLEAFAEQIATLIMQEYGISWLRLKVSKPSLVAQTAQVGLLIERGQRS